MPERPAAATIRPSWRRRRKNAVLTEGRRANRVGDPAGGGVIIRRAGNVQGEELGRAPRHRARPPAPACGNVGQRFGNASRSPAPMRNAARAVRQQKDRVVGAGIAIITIRLKVVSAAAEQRRRPQRSSGVSDDEAEHGRHVRGDHARAFGDPGDGVAPPVGG
ncbi:MAG: hypothetical protein U0521_08170 [Anaerolineae bacterium]